MPRRNRRKPAPPSVPSRLGPSAANRRAICAAKERYASEAEARSIALMNAPRGRSAAVSAYHCDVCGGWHLTTKARR